MIPHPDDTGPFSNSVLSLLTQPKSYMDVLSSDVRILLGIDFQVSFLNFS